MARRSSGGELLKRAEDAWQKLERKLPGPRVEGPLPPPREPGQKGSGTVRGVREEKFSLSRTVKWSMIAHGAAATLLILKTLVFPSEPPEYTPALRVDVVGLPDILKKDLHKVRSRKSKGDAEKTEAARPAEPKKPDPDVIALKKKKEAEARKRAEEKRRAELREKREEERRRKKIKSALSRIKALDRIDKVRDGGAEKAADSQVIKGNQVSRGSTLTGDAKETAETSYLDTLREQVKSNWALPVWLARQNHSAQLKIFLDSSGRVHRMRFTKPSGNRQFDDAVRQAVEDSQPFPEPPDDLKTTLLIRGVTLGFPL